MISTPVISSAFPREAAADVLAHQLRVFRRHEIGELAPDELHAIDADEVRELPVGVHDHFAVHQNRFVNALAELGERRRRGRAVALRPAGGAGEQVVDGADQGGDFRPAALEVHPPRQLPVARAALQLLRQPRERTQRPALQPIQHQGQSGDEREQQAQKPENRHLVLLQAFRLDAPRGSVRHSNWTCSARGLWSRQA